MEQWARALEEGASACKAVLVACFHLDGVVLLLV